MTPYYSATAVDLYLGDCLDVLPTLAAGSIDAVVTSPPYADQRSYGGATPDRYVEWIRPVLAELLRIVSPSGSMMLNLGRVFRGGEESPYAWETVRAARELGWRWIDTIIWRKVNAPPISPPAYLHPVHEYVFWLAPSTTAYRGYDGDTRRAYRSKPGSGIDDRKDEGYSGREVDRGRKYNYARDERGARPQSVFDTAVGSERGIRHTAPMSSRLARHLIRLATPIGGIVIDPFLGSGTTAREALATGRRAIGIELHEDALFEAVSRIAPALRSA